MAHIRLSTVHRLILLTLVIGIIIAIIVTGFTQIVILAEFSQVGQTNTGDSVINLLFPLLMIILAGLGSFALTIYYVYTRFFLRHILEISKGLEMAALSGRHELTACADLPADISSLADSVNRVIISLDDKQSGILRSEHARKSVEIRWEVLFRSAAEGILIGDEEGILTCNPRFEFISGSVCEDLVGTRIPDLPFQSQIGDGSISLQNIWERPEGEGERFVWYITPNASGSEKTHVLDVNMRYVEMNGRILRFLIMRDISEEVRLRNEQELAVRQIDENLGQLAALNDEIRNPLTMIAAWTELDKAPHSHKVMEGVSQINSIIDRIDKGYIASEKVRRFLQKSIDNYQGEQNSP